MHTLEKNNTWKVVDRPKEKKTIIRYKWLFKVKYKADGTLERIKARLVHSNLRYRLPNDICPVAKINIVRILLPLPT